MENLIDPLILNIIRNLTTTLRNSPTGVSFISIQNYINVSGEMSHNTLNIGVSFSKAREKDLIFLRNLDTSILDSKLDKILLEEARLELIAAFEKPEENRSQGQINAYTIITEGLKVHNMTGDLYVYGFRVKKEVLIEGEYKVVKSKPFTLAKNELRRLLKTDKYKIFNLGRADKLSLNKEVLEINLSK